jgi:hypothetical protein
MYPCDIVKRLRALKHAAFTDGHDKDAQGRHGAAADARARAGGFARAANEVDAWLGHALAELERQADFCDEKAEFHREHDSLISDLQAADYEGRAHAYRWAAGYLRGET